MSLHGLLLIDKPEGCTSHDVVQRVRRGLKLQSVGHAGTLDPLASGLLVILLGQATKISDFVLGADKSYQVTLRLGRETDTLDCTGTTVREAPVDVSDETIQRLANDLQGALQLMVPAFSAVKKNGRKLYEYARASNEVELPVREMTFQRVSWVGRSQPDLVTFDLTCSKGSYVRSWASRLGTLLGCGACVEKLIRIESAPYYLHQAMKLDQILAICEEGGDLPAALGSAYVPLSMALPQWPSFTAVGQEARLIQNGVIANSLKGRLMGKVRHSSGAQILNAEGTHLLALIQTDASCNFNIRRVFTYS